MSQESEFITFMRDNAAWRAKMVQALAADPQHLCCYYLCSWNTARQILQSGLRCRHNIQNPVDLAAGDMQGRRDTVWLGRTRIRREVLRNRAVHSCINTFLNPLNDTFYAFQRNAFLRYEADDSRVCILEFDLEAILLHTNCYWCITNRNVAAGAFNAFEMRHLLDHARFPWENIYSPRQPQDTSQVRKARAAECILFVDGGGEHSRAVLPRFCRRILVDFNAGAPFPRDIGGTLPIVEIGEFHQVTELLNYEFRFVEVVKRIRESDPNIVDGIAAAIATIERFEDEIGGPAPERFNSPNMPFGWHGTAHIVRVMFWAAFLTSHMDVVDGATNAVLAAALVHDLTRSRDDEDEGHGAIAADRHRGLLERANLGLAEMAADAVRYHSVADANVPEDCRSWLWQALKDSDALDRGRFAAPGKERGCNIDLLRTKQATELIAWLAFYLARMTRYEPNWGDRPCHRLGPAITRNLRVLVAQQWVNNAIRMAANEITLAIERRPE